MTDRIDTAITQPQSVSVDGQSVTSRSIDDEIKYATFKAATKVKRKCGFGLRTIPVQFPGSQR